MIISQDVEGEKLPVDSNGRANFGVYLGSANAYRDAPEEVYLVVHVPDFFETLDLEGESDQIYNGSGVLSVPFFEVLDEYANDAWKEDNGESLPLVLKQLKEFTEKLEKLNIELAKRRDEL
jgi:hypothetical protein